MIDIFFSKSQENTEKHKEKPAKPIHISKSNYAINKDKHSFDRQFHRDFSLKKSLSESDLFRIKHRDTLVITKHGFLKWSRSNIDISCSQERITCNEKTTSCNDKTLPCNNKTFQCNEQGKCAMYSRISNSYHVEANNLQHENFLQHSPTQTEFYPYQIKERSGSLLCPSFSRFFPETPPYGMAENIVDGNLAQATNYDMMDEMLNNNEKRRTYIPTITLETSSVTSSSSNINTSFKPIMSTSLPSTTNSNGITYFGYDALHNGDTSEILTSPRQDFEDEDSDDSDQRYYSSDDLLEDSTDILHSKSYKRLVIFIEISCAMKYIN